MKYCILSSEVIDQMYVLHTLKGFPSYINQLFSVFSPPTVWLLELFKVIQNTKAQSLFLQYCFFLVWPSHVSDCCPAPVLAGGIWTFKIATYPPNPLRLRAIPPHATCQHQSLTHHCIMPNTAPISAVLPISLSKTFGENGWQSVVFLW